MATENTLNPLEVAEYIQLTGEIIHEQEQKIASMDAELVKSRTALEKAAAEVAEPSKKMNETAVLKVMQKVAKVRPGVLGVTPEEATEKAIQNPEFVLDLMDKVAGDAFGVQVNRMGAPVLTEDAPVQKTAAKVSIERESDKVFESTFLG